MNFPPSPNADWPSSWRDSFAYDRLEIGDSPEATGYRFAYQRRVRLAVNIVQRAVAPPARILDIGAAQGNLTLALAEAGYRMTWNDIRPELVDYVRLKYESGFVEYRPGNAFDLKLDEPLELFDVVIATEIIEHMAHPDAFLHAIRELVTPGGHLVLTTPNGGYFRNQLPRFTDCADPSHFEERQFGPGSDDHIFLLHQEELAALAVAAGWRVREMAFCTTFVTAGHCGMNPLISRLPASALERLDRWIQRLPSPVLRRIDVTLGAWLQRM